MRAGYDPGNSRRQPFHISLIELARHCCRVFKAEQWRKSVHLNEDDAEEGEQNSR